MSEQVWICMPQTNTQLTRGFWSGFRSDDPPNHYFKNQGKILEKMLNGQLLKKDELPSEFYHYEKRKFRETLPQVFHSGYIFVNKKAADVLRQFDMGQGGPNGITLFEHDKVTKVSTDISLLNYGNAKDTVILDKSKQLEPLGSVEGVYHPDLPRPDDEDIVVRRNSLDGPDLWVDPRVWYCFFVSDKLARALIKEKLKNAFRMRRCRVV
ncbi:hypothetical protein [Yoonia sp. 2307UL14-13]|uniref:hypothetical protein n=1 Tax=Yoonia sp. 2307UL14-13 TaxID=3126506 RepID=UPI0030952B78